jgi:flagellar biosynthesis/type III secretory pathway protein FliH
VQLTISRTRIFVVAAIAAIVGLGATNVVTALNASDANAAHRHEVESLNDDHRAAIAALRRDAASDLADAVAEQRAHDRQVLRRALRKARRAADEQIAAARDQGYSSGSAAGHSQGYQEGNADGYLDGNQDGYESGREDGLFDGSDELDCSDDLDVGWLPACP